VEGNSIRGHERGIHIELKSRPLIRHNDINGNGTGIWAEKLVFPKILENTISGNDVGIYCNYSGYPEIHGNNIADNKRFGIVLGDNQSIHVEKLIPFRTMGQFYDAAPERPEFLPPQTRKYTPFTGDDKGLVDARGNWWGEAAAREMAEVGGEGDVSIIEDVHDKPDTFYQATPYPRDRVAFAPWEEAPLSGAGRPERSSSGIRGKAILGGEPIAGVFVHAYRSANGDFKGEGFAYALTGKDGSYTLNLAPRAYFLVAKRPATLFPHHDPGPGGLFGYYGGNPVTVTAGVYAESNIQVVRRRPQTVVGEAGREGAVVAGVVEGPGGPLEGASVHVYSDAARHFRGPGLFGPQGAVIGGTDSAGRFSIDLPAGSYYLVASKRQSGGFLGPLQPGDLHGYYDGNPVVVAAGTRVSATIQVVEKLKETAAPPRAGKGATGIRGTIHDPSGKGPAGVYAYATTDPGFMIGAMPPYRSRPVAEDGSYTIDLPGGGTYYVGARSGYGGPPLPGEWHGFLGGDAPSPVAVETGTVRERVDFSVRKME
jgi:parallel beta-helix repeat protein